MFFLLLCILQAIKIFVSGQWGRPRNELGTTMHSTCAHAKHAACNDYSNLGPMQFTPRFYTYHSCMWSCMWDRTWGQGYDYSLLYRCKQLLARVRQYMYIYIHNHAWWMSCVHEISHCILLRIGPNIGCVSNTSFGSVPENNQVNFVHRTQIRKFIFSPVVYSIIPQLLILPSWAGRAWERGYLCCMHGLW